MVWQNKSGPQDSNQVCRLQTPTCRHICKTEFHRFMSGTIFFICLTSAISAYFATLRISAWPAALKRWRKGCKNRKERKGSWQSQSRRRWTCPSLSRQVLRLWLWLRRKARGYLKHPVEHISQVQGNLTQNNTIKTQCRVLKDGKKMQFSM